MAKRRKLTAPSAEDLSALDAQFRSETPARPNPATAPISQIAAEAAQVSRVDDAQTRLDKLDAERMRNALAAGLVVVELPTKFVQTDQMVRDRTNIDPDELEELKTSIKANGQRLPIEVYKDGEHYALLSGYRRLLALRKLNADNPGAFETVKALVRPAHDTAASFVAMVEENEIRSNLSHYERGRIAVIAAQQGAFGSTEEAVNTLFGSGSKSKRSKVKSFAEVFEELGDLMHFPEALSERRGLRLAQALRQGGQRALREALAASRGLTAEAEWEALEPAIAAVEQGPQKIAKRGRPKAENPHRTGMTKTVKLRNGIVLRRHLDERGYAIHFSGAELDDAAMDSVMEAIADILS
ncbi:ParB/RepB/Spo0J family partition protein [Yoonia litorea]|uniref:Chromosome partitioning protein, ParB family n=1 Tax=Yoonia litorea TaxID=1123755 RepID=A0A1I6N3J3_9RHOB|nr:ParB N-terminal domain-containing protein [Yoonia litorea]SFS22516.1 chromosome partitioning protein, ParB family [Yoonia litorea]